MSNIEDFTLDFIDCVESANRNVLNLDNLLYIDLGILVCV